ncbi:MAG: hypothetical protein KBS94_08940 [Prevotella sp.]|nr:hypothetical protein [Candidatus Equicola faecalis]
MTHFYFGDYHIRFQTSEKLERYTDVREWDNGYIVVMAKYKDEDEMEEYIDLCPILDNLYINKKEFLNPIKHVKINYDEQF